MRILIVVSSSRLAGTERHVVELAGGLAAAAVGVEVACEAGGEGLDVELESRGVAVHRMGLTGTALASAVPRLARLSLGFDLVHAHLTHATAVALAARAVAGRPVIETRHFVALAHEGRGGLSNRAGRMRRAAIDRGLEVTIAPSQAVAARVAGDAVVVPHGIALGTSPERSGWSSRYVTVGRLETDRRVDLAIEGFAAADLPPTATLTVVGDGSQRAALESRARELGVGDRVVFAGRVPDVASYLAAADAFLATATEAFGLAALEAMAAALPVVGVNAGGVAELVVDGRTGLLVEPRADAFAKAITELESDPPDASALGTAARRRAEEEFSLERMVERTVEVYRRVAQRSGTGPKVLRVYHSAVMSAWRERDRELRRLGAEVSLVAPRAWREGARRVALDPGTDAFVTPARTFGHHPALFVYNPLPLVRLMRRHRFDVIDAHEEPYSLAAAEARLLARWLQPGAAFVFYSAQNLMKRYPWPIRRIESRTLGASAASYVCNLGAGDVLRRKGFTGEVVPLPLGVDMDDFSPRVAENRDGLVVGFVGRLTEQKGVDVLIPALAGQAGCELLVAGDGPERLHLEVLARTHGVAATFLGALPHAELPAFYRRLDILVVPSRKAPNVLEQFGRVAVEAMASGVPVIASHLGALPEVVGDAGILVAPDDVAALREALRSLAANREERRRLGDIGRRRASRYSWPEIAAAHHEIYEKALCISTS